MKRKDKLELYTYLFILLVILLFSLLPIKITAPLDVSQKFISPQWVSYPQLGTDALGRSLSSRLLQATMLSLALSSTALLTAMFCALTISIAATWLPSFYKKVLLWLPKALFIIPATFFSASILQLSHDYTLALWLTLMVAPIFSLTQHLSLSLLSQKHQAYWLYAQSTRSSRYYCIRYHQLPYALFQILPLAISRLSGLIVLEGSLSFLGLGLQDPNLTLGLLIQQSLQYMQSYPYLFFVPTLSFIFLLFLLQWLGLRVQTLLQHR